MTIKRPLSCDWECRPGESLTFATKPQSFQTGWPFTKKYTFQ